MYKYKISYRNILILFCSILFVFEIAYNGRETLQSISYEDRSKFINFKQDVGKVIDNIKENNDGFYRTEKTFEHNHNDAMLLDYNSLSHFSSIYKVDLRKVLGKLGLSETKYYEFYGLGSTIPVDSILSVRNVISKYNFNNSYEKGYSYKDMTVYNNPYWLPLGFMVNDKIRNVEVINNNAVTFEIQNEILNSMSSGEKVRYFNKIKMMDITTYNLGKKNHKYSIINKDDRAYIDIKLRTRKYQPIYMQLQTKGLESIEVISDGEIVRNYETKGGLEVINLGKYNSEKDITVRINFKNTEGYWLMNRIYSLNLREFNKLYNNLSENGYEISKYNDTNIVGDVTSTEDKSMLYTSIPYDDGWSVTIDGKKAEKVELLNAFIGVEIPKGTHKVEFNYMPQGLKIGAIISGASLVLLILICIINMKKRIE